VNNPAKPEELISGRKVAKNTLYNLFGYGLPLLVALLLIPPLIKGLGEEKFGILSLSWVVVGYFSFLDLGIGRALTKFIAEKLGLKQAKDIPEIFWTSIFLMLLISSAAAILLFFISKFFVLDIFKISEYLKEETLYSFYVLAFTIPIVTTTAGLRGLLEAYQEFKSINIIRIVLGVSTFLAPLLCLLFTKNLFWIVMTLGIIRIVIWLLYLFQCFRINPELTANIFKFNRNLIKPILSMSGWMTVSNIVAPIIIYLDRFLIGAVISAVAITYYITPYEVVTKLLLVPGALTGVLFPAFSSTYLNDPAISKKLFSRGVKFIFIFLYPVVLIIINFSYEGMNLWLDKTFADRSTFVMQMLALGVLLNSLAYIPFTYFQGIGKPKIPALVNLLELPFYCLLMWIATSRWGIEGAAVVWVLRIVVDTAILFILTEKLTAAKMFNMSRMFLFLSMISILIVSILISDIILKFLFTAVILLIFIILVWKVFLIDEEKKFLREKISMFKLSNRVISN
jgi:O-antigen/teichoic acid export membrane protein